MIPQISPFNFKDSTDSGETVSVQCTVSKGDLPLNITWQLNNRTIDKDGGITVMTMKRFSTLNIDSVQDVHTGEYTCTAQNLAGHSVYSARLNVNGNLFYCFYCFGVVAIVFFYIDIQDPNYFC